MERTARSDAHCSTHAVIFITFQALGWNYLTATGSKNIMVMFYFSVSAGHPASYNLEEQRTSVATAEGNIDLRAIPSLSILLTSQYCCSHFSVFLAVKCMALPSRGKFK